MNSRQSPHHVQSKQTLGGDKGESLHNKIELLGSFQTDFSPIELSCWENWPRKEALQAFAPQLKSNSGFRMLICEWHCTSSSNYCELHLKVGKIQPKRTNFLAHSQRFWFHSQNTLPYIGFECTVVSIAKCALSHTPQMKDAQNTPLSSPKDRDVIQGAGIGFCVWSDQHAKIAYVWCLQNTLVIRYSIFLQSPLNYINGCWNSAALQLFSHSCSYQ